MIMDYFYLLTIRIFAPFSDLVFAAVDCTLLSPVLDSAGFTAKFFPESYSPVESRPICIKHRHTVCQLGKELTPSDGAFSDKTW